MSGTYLPCLNMSEITHRGLPRIATLHQVVVEGGHSYYKFHTGNNLNLNADSWVVHADDPWPRLRNKKLHSLRRVATAHNMTPRVDQIKISHEK